MPTIAVLPAHKDDPFVVELLRDGIDCRPEQPAGAVRVNLTLTEPDGTTTKINTPGAVVTRADLDRLAAAVTQRARQASWVVLAGSLPPGRPGVLVRRAGRPPCAAPRPGSPSTPRARPLVALAAGLEQQAPHLMKPNGEELASLTGGDADAIEADPAAAAAAAAVLVGRGVEAVLATLGGSGAVLVTAEGAWHAVPPPDHRRQHRRCRRLQPVRLPAGRRCAALEPAERLRLAVAYGSAAAALPGTTIPTPTHIRPDLVEVRELARPRSHPGCPHRELRKR